MKQVVDVHFLNVSKDQQKQVWVLIWAKQMQKEYLAKLNNLVCAENNIYI